MVVTNEFSISGVQDDTLGFLLGLLVDPSKQSVQPLVVESAVGVFVECVSVKDCFVVPEMLRLLVLLLFTCSVWYHLSLVCNRCSVTHEMFC